MMSRGTPEWIAIVCHDDASKPGMPTSLSGGTSLSAGTRSPVVTPSARSLPALISASAGGMSANMNAICPPMRSFSAGTVPL